MKTSIWFICKIYYFKESKEMEQGNQSIDYEEIKLNEEEYNKLIQNTKQYDDRSSEETSSNRSL